MITKSYEINPTDIIKYCYESTIFNQNITSTLLENYVLESTGKKKSDGVGFFGWIKKQLHRIAEIVRKWVTAIVNFFTKTLPSTIGGFVDKILIFFKLKKEKTKKIDMPKNATREEKDNVKKATDIANKATTKKMVIEITGNTEKTNDIEEAKKEIKKIPLVPDIREKLDEAMKKGYILVYGDSDDITPIISTKCRKIASPISKTLKKISELCKVRTDVLDKQISDIQDMLNSTSLHNGFLQSTAADDMASNQTIKDFIATQYAQSKGYYSGHGEMYLRKDLSNFKLETMSVDEVKKELLTIRETKKSGDIIKKAAEDQSKKLLDLCNQFEKSFSNENDQKKAQKYINVLSQLQNAVVKYVSDATKDYASYANFAINEYKAAIANKNNRNNDNE